MELELREKLLAFGNKLVDEGLVQGTWGNLSIRLDETYMLVTPSGLDYRRLTAADMVKVNLKTLEYEGSLKPTSEKGIHAGIYLRRPDIHAVIHTHSKYCSIFAAARKPLPVETPELEAIFGKEIPLAKYGSPGTKKLMEHTVGAFGDGLGCIMTSHGMICGGDSIEAAFDHCCKMEACAENYIESRWD